MGLLDYISQKAKEIPENAKAAYRGLLAAPEELAALFSPEMRQNVNKGMNAPATLDRDKVAGMAMDFLQTTPAGLLGHIVYHGSPHKFDKFDMSKIGTGEGAQAYGHGLYFAESPSVAKSYQEKLSPRRFITNDADVLSDYRYTSKGRDVFVFPDGSALRVDENGYMTASTKTGFRNGKSASKNTMARELSDEYKGGFELADGAFYKVDIPDESIPRMLDLDKPLSEQSNEIQDAFKNAARDAYGFEPPDLSRIYGHELKNWMNKKGRPIEKSLAEQGIPGIRYFDGSSRGAGQGTSNFVLFDDQLPRILEVNGQPTGLLSYADEAAKKKRK